MSCHKIYRIRFIIRGRLEGKPYEKRQRIFRYAKSLKRMILVFSLMIFLYSAYGFYRVIQINQREKNENIALTHQYKGNKVQKNQKDPLRLKIPKIHVDVPIENVGITPEGAMATPSNTIHVGWFSLGPRPGELGSSVIAGHFDGEHGETGVFMNLSKLKQGDNVYIENGYGELVTFKVRKSQYFNPGYADSVFNQTETAHLNLITCEGFWTGAKIGYSKRLVVFSDLVN